MNLIEKFHKDYPGINLTELAKRADINESLLRQYAVGIKTPSVKTLNKVQIAINSLGAELVDVDIDTKPIPPKGRDLKFK